MSTQLPPSTFVESAPLGRSIYTDNTGRYFMVWGARKHGGPLWAPDLEAARGIAETPAGMETI